MPPRAARSLSREAILDAAFAIVDESGATALTLRRLGAALGVDHTAVLRHFADKDEIVLGLCERMLETALADFAPTPDWRTTLEALARQMRSACLRHPQVAVLTANRVSRRPAELHGADLVVQALLDAGFDPPEAARVYRTVVDIALALSSFQAASATLGDQAREQEAEAWRREYLTASPTHYPALAQAAPYLAEVDEDVVFESALRLVLDAVAARAAATHA